MDEILLTPAQVAERFCVTVQTVKRWSRAGLRGANGAKRRQLMSIRVGGSMRFRESDLTAWIAANNQD